MGKFAEDWARWQEVKSSLVAGATGQTKVHLEAALQSLTNDLAGGLSAALIGDDADDRAAAAAFENYDDRPPGAPVVTVPTVVAGSIGKPGAGTDKGSLG